MATAASETSVQQLYIAYFGRPADPAGLAFYADALDAGTTTIADIASSFGNSTEAAPIVALSTTAYLEAVYQQAFGRTYDPAVDGTFWADAIDSGATTKELAMIQILDGAQANDILARDNKTSVAVTFTTAVANDGATYDSDDITAAKNLLTAVTSDAATVATGNSAAETLSASLVSFDGETLALTTSVDTIVGGAGNDTITGLNDGASTTITGLDSIDGGAGTDKFVIEDVAGGLNISTGIQVSNVEQAVGRSTGAITIDSSTWTGLELLKTTLSGATTLTAATTTDIEVTGASGAVVVNGGNDSDVTTSASTVTVGATTVGSGAVAVTHTNQVANTIAVDGGTSVSITASNNDAGAINVGQGGAATDLPSGAVVVNSTGKAYVAATADTLGNIAVDGGSTVSVTQSATSDASAAATDGAAATLTQGNVAVDAQGVTTSVTVTQDEAVAAKNGAAAVAEVKETSVVTFKAMTSGQTLIINGLTFTASKNLTAEQVAEAFAGLTAADTQDAGGSTANGVYTGAFNSAVWTSGDASGAVVTFTAQDDDETDLTFGGTASAPTQVKAAGTAGTTAVTGNAGIVAGTVTIADSGATDSLTTVTLDGYGNSTVASDALTTLSLANSGTGTMTVTSAATSLNLTVNDVDAAVSLDGGSATITSLNLTTATADSAFALTAAAVTSLAVSGTQNVNLTGSTLSALQTLTVAGSAGVTVDASGATVTSVDASGTSGNNTITVNAVNATYTGGTGTDAVTLSAVAPTKAVNLGDGDDSLTLASGTTAVTGSLTGGAGTDTLVMVAADAATADNSAAFAAAVTAFERVSLTAVDGGQSFDLNALGAYNYVTVDGVDDDGGNADEDATLAGLTSGATVVVTDVIGLAADDDRLVVNITDAATGASDVLNLGVTAAGALAAGEVVAANVETINITATDTTANVVPGTNAQSVELTAVNATTVTVSGNSAFTLTNTGNIAQTSIDASAMTGSLTVTAAGTTATSITGGAGNDNLTASNAGDTLIGGAGNDTLTAGDLATLTGGEGADTFMLAVPTNVNSYATITDIATGDIIDLDAGNAGTVNFTAAAISLANTAVFQDYANAAVNALGTDTNDAAWFQFEGNTYIVQSGGDHNATPDFQNGQDSIIQLTGLVDLSTASYNQTVGTLEVA